MSRLSDERGLALVPALATIVIVLMLGAAALATVNVQSHQSGLERAQEGAFQVAESALNTQTLQLSRKWPNNAAAAYGACNQSTAASATCTGAALAGNFTTVAGGAPNGGSDFGTTPTWSTRVIDDVDGSAFYDDALASRAPAPCACDANADGAVWVRSEATVGGRKSVVVNLVQQSQPRLEALPTASIIAGAFETSNEGKKVIVDATGRSATAGVVAVRCVGGPASGDACLGYDPTKGQLNPEDAYQTGYVDGTALPNATNRSILDAEALARLKQTAQTYGSYYATGCPSTLTGALVYIENASCSYTSSTQFNSAASPGVVIFGAGTLSLGGTTSFYGLIYNANGQGSAPGSGPCTAGYKNEVVSLNGDASVVGAILVDKCGSITAGASGVNIVFDSNVFANVVSNGTAASIKNTFRIVPAG